MSRYFKLKVRAGARENRLTVRSADSLIVSVSAPAENGRANKAALALVAAHLNVPVGKLWLVKGARTPAKIIEIRD